MPYSLGAKSWRNLAGVHEDLVKVVERAIELSTVDFTVLEGLRSFTRQQRLFDAGASKTLKSRHLSGHAVDLGAWVDNQVAWDWPLYEQIAKAMFAAAVELNVPIEWGGNWSTFKDGPHFQLPWGEYPA